MGHGSMTASGDVGYLTNEVARGREGYYTDAVVAGEPPGRWHGKGAAALGLTGVIDNAVIESVYTDLKDPRDPTGQTRLGVRRVYPTSEERYAAALAKDPGADSVRRAEMWRQAESGTRTAVAFYDFTFSAGKTISTAQAAMEHAMLTAADRGDAAAAAAWAENVRFVDEAILAAVGDALDYAERACAYARVGHHGGGEGRWSDTAGLTVGSFVQHTNRDLDPLLHVHNAIQNNVECADGKRRALDGALLFQERGAMAAIAERSLEARLTERFGWTFVDRADGHGRELDPALVSAELAEAFSFRRHAIENRTAELLDAYRDEHGREPTRREAAKLAQRATLETRPAKSHDGISKRQQVTAWARQALAVVPGGLPAVAARLTGRSPAVPTTAWSKRDVIERALAGVGALNQTWTRSDLLRAVGDALPANLGMTPERAVLLLEQLTDTALAGGGAVRITAEQTAADLVPASARLADGRTALARPGSVKYATTGQLAAERALRAAAVQRGAAVVDAAQADALVGRYAAAGHPLGEDQAAALRGVLTSGARLEVLSAAAGTGKTFVVGAIADAWQSAIDADGTPAGRRVFGLAQSQIATAGLAAEGLTASRNLAAWAAGQARVEAGRAVEGDAAFTLRSGDLVMVDEAGMADTAALLEVQQRCAAADAKLLLIGDARQLAAVGAGGTLSDVSEHGITYELAEVRRFSAAWERSASLRLRDGEPSVIADYDRHGRIHDGGTIDQARALAERLHLADVLTGRDSLLVVPTNEQAAAASRAIHDQLVQLGRVDVGGVPLSEGTTAAVGDLVQYRHNAWHLAGVDGNVAAPINRDVGRVVAVRDDGGLVTAPVTGRDEHGAEILGAPLQLPREYTAAHVALGYASTVHAAQGRTVYSCYSIAGRGTTPDSLYVALTRGTDRNVVCVITRATPADTAPGVAHDVDPSPAAGILRDIVGTPAERNTAALQQQERDAAEEHSTRSLLDALTAGVDLATAGRTAAVLDRLTAEGRLTEDQRRSIAADEAFGSLDRLVRYGEIAGHDRGTVLSAALSTGSLDGSRSTAKVLHSRVQQELRGKLTPQLDSFHDLIPAGHDTAWTPYLSKVADLLDERRGELGAEVADRGDAWAVRDLGDVPDDPTARLEWEDRAGWAQTWRELAGVDSDADPLGAAPPSGAITDHAVFRTAHHVLDRPEAGAEEAEASDGLLRIHARAGERARDLLPRNVDGELAATTQAVDKRAADAVLWQARAAATDTPAERDRLLADAAEAQADADRLAAQRDQLEEIAAARDEAVLHTAITRDKAERARIELAIRGIDRDRPDDLTTGEQWLAAHQDAMRGEDPHRPVTDELDLVDVAAERTAAHETAMLGDGGLPAAEHKEQADRDTTSHSSDDTREPGADPLGTNLTVGDDRGRTRLERGEGQPVAGPLRADARDDPNRAAEENRGDRHEAEPRAGGRGRGGVGMAAGAAMVRDDTEDLDPTVRRRVPPPDETREHVEKARDALLVVAAQRADDAARDAEETARADEAAREAQEQAEQADRAAAADTLAAGR
jgi:conjugative relaxase-like TrwC/TraI family protein